MCMRGEEELFRSGLAVNLGPPPAYADKQESPVAKKLGRLALEGVTDELEDPSQDKQSGRIGPQAMQKNAADKNRQREQNGRYPQSMADPIYGMLVTRSVLR